MPTAIILVLVALGSVLFHLLSPWWWTPIASNWGYIDNTIIITFWITEIVFTSILLFMAYCVFRFRHQQGRRAVYNPENKKLEWWLSIVTAVGVGAMLAPGLFVWSQFVTVPEGASEVEVLTFLRNATCVAKSTATNSWKRSETLPDRSGTQRKCRTFTVASAIGGPADALCLSGILHGPATRQARCRLPWPTWLHQPALARARARRGVAFGRIWANQATLIRPSWVSALMPSSRPIS